MTDFDHLVDDAILSHPLYDLALEEVVALAPSLSRLPTSAAVRAPHAQQLMVLGWLSGMDWQRRRFLQLLKDASPERSGSDKR